MMEEKIEIPNCPLCRNKHAYSLKVERTFVMHNVISLTDNPQPVKITRIFICPVKNKRFQATFTLYQTSIGEIKNVTVEGVVQDETEYKAEDRLTIESVSLISPHNEALYETGKEKLKSSISTARDFCKFMITVSTGSIPIYLGLLKLVSPTNITFSLTELLLFTLPPFFFLISAIVFILGYFPQTDYFSLDVIDEIRSAYEKTIIKRRKFIIYGTALYVISIILAMLSILIRISR